MKNYLSIILAAALLLGFSSCGKDPKPAEEEQDPYKGLKELTFKEYEKKIANPERGFYSGITVVPGKAVSNATIFKTWRRASKTVTLIEVELDNFVNSDIPQSFLDLIQEQFDAVREGGIKCVLRFGYSWDYRADGADEPKYDATVEQCLKHVAQLKPLMQKNSDIIMCLQAGFIGIWGEWYYSDNFESAGSAKFTGRKQLVEALLDAMPANRQIQMRTGAYKAKCLNVSYSDTLNDANAYQPTPLARLGFHNDCFLADGTDKGTWGNKQEKAFMVNASEYTIMGGETCALHSTYCKCDYSIKTMEEQHWTYLHDSYHPDVLQGWRTQKCYSEIELRLGYRLILDKAHVTETDKAGEDVRVALEIRNAGFSSPQNPRDAELLLVDASGKATVVQLPDEDPRFWKAGQTHVLDVTFKAPAAGSYDVCLNLPDPEESLRNNPDYSIRLANEDVWVEEKGYNKIYTLTVE